MLPKKTKPRKFNHDTVKSILTRLFPGVQIYDRRSDTMSSSIMFSVHIVRQFDIKPSDEQIVLTSEFTSDKSIQELKTMLSTEFDAVDPHKSTYIVKIYKCEENFIVNVIGKREMPKLTDIEQQAIKNTEFYENLEGSEDKSYYFDTLVYSASTFGRTVDGFTSDLNMFIQNEIVRRLHNSNLTVVSQVTVGPHILVTYKGRRKK